MACSQLRREVKNETGKVAYSECVSIHLRQVLLISSEFQITLGIEDYFVINSTFCTKVEGIIVVTLMLV